MNFNKSQKTIIGYVLSVAIGSITGIITLIGQKYLPVNLNFLSNSASVWVVPAFLVSYCIKSNKKQSALYGMIILMLCVMSYYVFEAVCNHHSYFINGHQLFWFGCAMIGGPVIGLCGNCSRTREDFIGNICRNILPAVFITEAFSKLFHISDYRHMIPAICLQMGIGIVIYVMLNRMKTLKKENMIAFICLLIPGSIGFELLRRIG